MSDNLKIYDKEVTIKAIKPNPKNPRVIRNHKFQKLVQSIIDFPEMLNLREIVVDENMVILGGNMRFKACIEAGLKKVIVKVIEGLSEDKKDEFIIKDNANYGQWNWDTLANSFDEALLQHWGLNVWQPDQHTTWDDSDDDDTCDDEVVDTDDVPDSGGVIKDKPQVIQIEFMLGDYDEAYGLATYLRSKGVDLGKVLIQSMKEYAD